MVPGTEIVAKLEVRVRLYWACYSYPASDTKRLHDRSLTPYYQRCTKYIPSAPMPYTCIGAQAQRHSHRHTDRHRRTHTHTHTVTHGHTHTHGHTRSHTATHTHTHTVTHGHRHRYRHTHTHTVTHSHRHRHTDTDTVPAWVVVAHKSPPPSSSFLINLYSFPNAQTQEFFTSPDFTLAIGDFMGRHAGELEFIDLEMEQPLK